MRKPTLIGRFEELEVTPELLMTGLTLWNTPIKGIATHLNDGIRDLLELSWDAWRRRWA